jgi:phosphatidylserine/phosphatidylglycerophosphate/cardiolipin synthase-like enzyme
MYEAILDLADSHVYIVNDFPIVTALERAIYRLLARDVSVKLLTGNAAARRDDGTFFPAPLHRTAFEYMVKAKLEPLLRAGVQVYEFVPPPSPIVVARGGRVRPYVHAKLVSVDGKVTSIGSANLDATASFWESEANIVVQDSAFTASVEAILQELIDGSVELDPESDYWKRERAQRAIVDTLWPGTFYS